MPSVVCLGRLSSRRCIKSAGEKIGLPYDVKLCIQMAASANFVSFFFGPPQFFVLPAFVGMTRLATVHEDHHPPPLSALKRLKIRHVGDPATRVSDPTRLSFRVSDDDERGAVWFFVCVVLLPPFEDRSNSKSSTISPHIRCNWRVLHDPYAETGVSCRSRKFPIFSENANT